MSSFSFRFYDVMKVKKIAAMIIIFYMKSHSHNKLQIHFGIILLISFQFTIKHFNFYLLWLFSRKKVPFRNKNDLRWITLIQTIPNFGTKKFSQSVWLTAVSAVHSCDSVILSLQGELVRQSIWIMGNIGSTKSVIHLMICFSFASSLS